jgi:hypothetical protein
LLGSADPQLVGTIRRSTPGGQPGFTACAPHRRRIVGAGAED